MSEPVKYSSFEQLLISLASHLKVLKSLVPGRNEILACEDVPRDNKMHDDCNPEILDGEQRELLIEADSLPVEP